MKVNRAGSLLGLSPGLRLGSLSGLLAVVLPGIDARSIAVALIAAVLALGTSGCASAKQVALENALLAKQITASFKSRGTYGDIVVATITSSTDQAIEVTITPGTLLTNTTRTGESLVLYRYKGKLATATSANYQENAKLVLSSRNAEQIALLEAYSVNALGEPAQVNDTFAVSATASTDVQAILKVFTDNDSIQAKQVAIWAVTDNISTENLNTMQFTYKPGDLDMAKSILQRAKLDPTKYKVFA